MKRIYIAGCGGMLGEAFYTQFREFYQLQCTDKDVNETWLSFMDFRDYENYRRQVIDFRPDYLFHLGAFTDLEYCEKNPLETYRNNTTGVENAVLIANEMNIPLLYISTAGIFDGKKPVYDDWDEPNPLSVYGRSKYMGERYVVENADRYLVCRAGWMMGGGPKKDKKFIQKIMCQIRSGATELFVVNDKNGTPTYTHDFAKTVKFLLQKEYWGLYNCVCSEPTSRLEVAQELLKILSMEEKVHINEVESFFFKKEYFATRPDSEQLLTLKLNIRGIATMRPWREALAEYIQNYYQGYLAAK